MALIVKKKWLLFDQNIELDQECWYLFGIIPLYLKNLTRGHKKRGKRPD